MNIRVELDETIESDEIVIRCRELNEDISELHALLTERTRKPVTIVFHKEGQEYYLPLGDILFFQTDNSQLTAHTDKEVYSVKYRLYELEEILPNHFVRISKSTIVNSNHVYSILKNITSASKVAFKNTHKKVYVSRNYYPYLKSKLLEKRF